MIIRPKLRFPRLTGYFPSTLSLSDFIFKRKLGQGTFGQVGLYIHRQDGRPYAIKRIPLFRKKGKHYLSPQEIIHLTRKELEILYKTDNQYILKLMDHFQDNDAIYLVTQYIEGENLFDATLRKGTKLTPADAAQVVYQLCDGLQQLHGFHVIHRDIKLENLIFYQDFGCSNFYGEHIKRHTTIGTQAYWSPQILNQQDQNDRLDVWCVGVVLYQILFLRQPFREQPDNSAQKKIRKCQFTYPKDAVVDPDLDDLFRKIFITKNARIKASEVKKHAWIKRYRVEKERKCFQAYFREDEVNLYRQMLQETTQGNRQFLQGVKKRTSMLEGMLRQARRGK